MADQKISDLAALSGANLASGDLLVAVDVSDTSMAASGTDKKTTIADLRASIRSGAATARTGALAETIDRAVLNNQGTALVSGAIRVGSVQLNAGDVISNVVFVSGTTAAVTPTHQYAVILDSSGTVVAVSADGTNAAIAAGTEISYAVSYTVPTTGCYYLGWCVTAGTMPTMMALTGQPANVIALAPARCGSVASQTSPPSVGAALTITSSAVLLYGYVK